jgi:hypothetical protein
VSSCTQAMKSNHLFLVFKVTFIDLYLAFCVIFQSVALKEIIYFSLACLQYYSMTEHYLKYCVTCSNAVVIKNKSDIKILEDKFTPLNVWNFANHRSEIPSGQQWTYIKQSLMSCIRCKKIKYSVYKLAGGSEMFTNWPYFKHAISFIHILFSVNCVAKLWIFGTTCRRCTAWFYVKRQTEVHSRAYSKELQPQTFYWL